MIPFFRKIRKTLADDNKPLKYLKYAIGEIALVVIGILIALQINNWNESRKLANTESIYLKRFLSELKQDTTYFSKGIKTFKLRNQIITDFSAALNDNYSEDSTVIRLANDFFRQGWFMASFRPSTSTFDDLSSTGNLNVIRNINLRDAIVKMYYSYNETQDGFKVNHDWITPIDAMLTSQYNGLKYDSTTSFLYNSESLNERVNELRRDREIYIRNASNHYWSNQSSIGSFNESKVNCTDLLEKINKYLNQDQVFSLNK